METFSVLLALCVGNSVSGEFPTQRPVTWSFDDSLIWAWINTWVNNREAGDLRCYRAHYDVIVMCVCEREINTSCISSFFCESQQNNFVPNVSVTDWLSYIHFNKHIYIYIHIHIYMISWFPTWFLNFHSISLLECKLYLTALRVSTQMKYLHPKSSWDWQVE